jgi:hypothetical protein
MGASRDGITCRPKQQHDQGWSHSGDGPVHEGREPPKRCDRCNHKARHRRPPQTKACSRSCGGGAPPRAPSATLSMHDHMSPARSTCEPGTDAPGVVRPQWPQGRTHVTTRDEDLTVALCSRTRSRSMMETLCRLSVWNVVSTLTSNKRQGLSLNGRC